jgi:hypothetical protein
MSNRLLLADDAERLVCIKKVFVIRVGTTANDERFHVDISIALTYDLRYRSALARSLL